VCAADVRRARPSKKTKSRNRCFACGEANREGLRLRFTYDPATKTASCHVRIEPKYQGATGFAHGGIIGTLLDEAMAKANGMGGIRAMTARLEISYRKAVPLKTKLFLTGRRIKKQGRKLYLKSELRSADNILLAEASGLFIEVNPNTEQDSIRSRLKKQRKKGAARLVS
jgi:acyl-coenzyme A thioesterase PaaI-like protein